MAIDTTKTDYNLRMRLPYEVESGVQVLSTGNETANLCQVSPITIDEPSRDITVEMPARSLNTYIFMIHREDTGIEEQTLSDSPSMGRGLFNLQGQRISGSSDSSVLPKGVYIVNGKKVMVKWIFRH